MGVRGWLLAALLLGGQAVAQEASIMIAAPPPRGAVDAGPLEFDLSGNRNPDYEAQLQAFKRGDQPSLVPPPSSGENRYSSDNRSIDELINEQFPRLNGRIVDRANVLDSASTAALQQMLDEHERQTSDQIVVVTLGSLRGNSIEEFGYRLGRYWGVGQKGKNNGALLIVAPNDHQVRIEVGYGLEGRLTDAQSSLIIHQLITPAFKQGQFAQGITDGVTAMIDVLGGQALPALAEDPRQFRFNTFMAGLFVVFVLFFIYMVIRAVRSGTSGDGSSSGSSGRSSSSSGSSRSGGGGGSFGGGGASGSW